MALTSNVVIKEQLSIPAIPKNLTHNDKIKLLGISINDKLKYNDYLVDGPHNLLAQLNVRIAAIAKLVNFGDLKFNKQLANGIFQGKLVYGMEVWGTAPEYIIKRIQSSQLKAARTVLGPRSYRWSTSRCLSEMKWMNIKQMIEFKMAKMAHRIVNTGKPEYLSIKMLNNENARVTRNSTDRKIGIRGNDIGRTNVTKNTFRYRIYDIYNKIPGILTNIKSKNLFSTRLKRYIYNKNDIPDYNDPKYARNINNEIEQHKYYMNHRNNYNMCI